MFYSLLLTCLWIGLYKHVKTSPSGVVLVHTDLNSVLSPVIENSKTIEGISPKASNGTENDTTSRIGNTQKLLL